MILIDIFSILNTSFLNNWILRIFIWKKILSIFYLFYKKIYVILFKYDKIKNSSKITYNLSIDEKYLK